MNPRLALSPFAAACIAAWSLAACSRHDVDTAERHVDRATAQARQETHEARADANRALDRAQQSVNEAGAKVAGTVSDAAITTTINAELARDAALDPSKIDVDTSQGRVVLRGSAPDESAKERAKRIALAVNGVRGVDNYLTVSKG